ncbi:MAG: hypothetical protein EPN22_02290 [Nitrospirae bacterium]|nr:MAG: hypothetical protein EPN22_02290 [Nitrospirota bacterium]
MSHIQFAGNVMFCNSTGNQTVNLLPAIQLGCKKIKLFCTQHTAKYLTKRLTDVAGKYGIDCLVEHVSENEEKNLNTFADKFIHCAKEFDRVIWNISGGQKIPSSAMLNAFQKRSSAGFDKDFVVYIEAAPPAIWYFGSDYESKRIRTSAVISLQDILFLAGFETLGDENKIYPASNSSVVNKLEVGMKAFEYFKNDELFREAFFSHMKPSTANFRTPKEITDLLKEELKNAKPNIEKLKVTKEGYKNLEVKINNVFSQLNKAIDKETLYQIIKPLKIIQKPSELYEDYWNSIKKTLIDHVLENIELQKIRLIAAPIKSEQSQGLIEQISSIGGQSEYSSGDLYKKNILLFSSLRSNGLLFEWMVAAVLLDEIGKDDRLKENISEVYHSVKTKKLDSDDKHDAEHDIIIVTKFGTLIIIELKTYEFSGDIAQAQDGLAYKKSGPYGSAMIVGPLLSKMIQVKKNGQKEFPHYIDGPIKTQADTARQNGIDYYYIDQILDMLMKKLFIK